MLRVSQESVQGVIFVAEIGAMEMNDICKCFNQWKRIIQTHRNKDAKKEYADMELMDYTARILGAFVKDNTNAISAFETIDIDEIDI